MAGPGCGGRRDPPSHTTRTPVLEGLGESALVVFWTRRRAAHSRRETPPLRPFPDALHASSVRRALPLTWPSKDMRGAVGSRSTMSVDARLPVTERVSRVSLLGRGQNHNPLPKGSRLVFQSDTQGLRPVTSPATPPPDDDSGLSKFCGPVESLKVSPSKSRSSTPR